MTRILASLVEKGLASARPGTVVKYAALAPELAVERKVDPEDIEKIHTGLSNEEVIDRVRAREPELV